MSESPALLDIAPFTVYDTQRVRAAIGESLWRQIAPTLPRLCQGRVLGEDLLDALRRQRKPPVDNSTPPRADQRHDAANHTGTGGGEKNAEDAHRRKLRVRLDHIAR